MQTFSGTQGGYSRRGGVGTSSSTRWPSAEVVGGFLGVFFPKNSSKIRDLQYWAPDSATTWLED